jgi:lysophospholipase L1-like esterase
MGGVHRAATLPGLAYELAPNMQHRKWRTQILTNSHGMRDDEVALEKPVGTRRIAAVGDSFTFGWGLPGPASYPAQLERQLEQRRREGEPAWEVLNMGVGAYSARDEALVVRHKALAFEPDLILVGYCLNDPEVEPVVPLVNYFAPVEWWQSSDLMRRLAKLAFAWRISSIGGGDYFEYLHRYEPRWSTVVAAFEDMGRVSRETGIPIVVVVFPVLSTREAPLSHAPRARWDLVDWSEYRYRSLHAQVARAAEEAGLRTLDLLERFSRHDPKRLRISKVEVHTTEFGNAEAAAAVLELLRREMPQLFADE